MEPVFIYTAFADVAQARKLGRRMLEEHMIACFNIFPGMQAAYWWKGRIEEANEAAMFIMTTSDRVSDVTDFMRLEHPYELPCVIALPLVDGDPVFMKWMTDNSGLVIPPKMPPINFEGEG